MRTYSRPTPISKRPLQWYLDRHHELWEWLVENPGTEKNEWPGWKRFKRSYWAYCFACQMLVDYGMVNDGVIDCSKCLFKWSDYDGTCEAAAFGEWENIGYHSDERSILAFHIKYMLIRECYQKELGKNECS